jgi:hypothetical protein
VRRYPTAGKAGASTRPRYAKADDPGRYVSRQRQPGTDVRGARDRGDHGRYAGRAGLFGGEIGVRDFRGLCRYADRPVAGWQQLPPDPLGTTYGLIDGHGWNMAFDHACQQLNGIYGFDDSGFAALHQEFIYSNWIAPDLTGRIVAGYEALTGRALDRRRIELLSNMLRLPELAEFANDADHAGAMLRNVADWAARLPP